MPAALKLGRGQLLGRVAVVLDPPVEHSVVVDLLPEVLQMPLRERILCHARRLARSSSSTAPPAPSQRRQGRRTILDRDVLEFGQRQRLAAIVERSRGA